MKEKKVFAIYGNTRRNQSVDVFQKVIDALEKKSEIMFFFEPLFKIIEKKIKITLPVKLFNTPEDLFENVDCILSIGGDGTFLGTLLFASNNDIPVLGINNGQLGFLANIQIEDLEMALQNFIDGDYELDQRAVLEIIRQDETFLNKPIYALNDVTIRRSENASMLSVKVDVNDEFLNNYWADGIIVSTPTGSTAYSLSCGGPILMPKSNAFIITPIASHTLTVRPLVLSDESFLSIKVSGRTSHYTLGVDSSSYKMDISTPLIVKKAPFKIKIVKLNQHSFLKTIREKLFWGHDKRN
ncbi:MAG: NAD kinase [Bacteroidales bacterium]|nr:NAD kinase [Bacteroidales bacterium]MDY0215319.1 NAD kinase [Bacteroidales bacterium]